MRISGGLKEHDTFVGNASDKYGSQNPVVRWIMRGFETSLSELVTVSHPTSIHEVGCGEGYWVLHWNEQGFAARGTDFSRAVIDIARSNARERLLPPQTFEARSIYDVTTCRDSADLIVCSEVLEHLKYPEAALEALQRIVARHVIVSVPREPLWRILNVARGKYVSALGNTPGHIQHWSRREFLTLIRRYFDILDIRTPLPWTMLLGQARH